MPRELADVDARPGQSVARPENVANGRRKKEGSRGRLEAAPNDAARAFRGPTASSPSRTHSVLRRRFSPAGHRLLPGQQAAGSAQKQQWKTVPFAIVRYNDDAPKSWNVYHGEKKGIYLVRLWKRYLLIDTGEQSAYEIDPGKVKIEGENAELNSADIPSEPIETAEWKSRDAGPVLRHRFRFGKTGNFMELQIPLLPSGKPVY